MDFDYYKMCNISTMEYYSTLQTTSWLEVDDCGTDCERDCDSECNCRCVECYKGKPFVVKE